MRRRDVSPLDLIDSAIDAMERVNGDINCVVQKLRDHALKEVKGGIPFGPFYGVPFLVKEFGMHFKGMKTSAGSRLADGITFDEDTELMRRFKQAGLVTVRTSTTPEMAFNVTCLSLMYGPTRNPWNRHHVVGGWSGGAGAAVASGMVPIAHANDGGESIQIPGACNGVVALKPTRRRTPTGPDMGILLWGLAVEFAVTRSVRDSAALPDAVAGPDDGYFYCAFTPKRSFLAAAMSAPPRLRIGVVEQLPGADKIDREIKERLTDTVKLLEGLGHNCESVQIKYDAEMFSESSMRLWAVTLTYFLDLFAGITGREIGRQTCEAVTREIYQFGHSLKALELEKAMSEQNQISRVVGAVMRQYDVLLTPGFLRDIARIGEFNQNAEGVDMRDWWQLMFQKFSAFTPLFNTTGQPALMLPLWQARSGLPLAMQFVGRLNDEETLFSLAIRLEQALPWSGRRPVHYAWARNSFCSPTVRFRGDIDRLVRSGKAA